MKLWSGSIVASKPGKSASDPWEFMHEAEFIVADTQADAEAWAVKHGLRVIPTSDGWRNHSVRVVDITDMAKHFVNKMNITGLVGESASGDNYEIDEP
jgi:hypothetical protein